MQDVPRVTIFRYDYEGSFRVCRSDCETEHMYANRSSGPAGITHIVRPAGYYIRNPRSYRPGLQDFMYQDLNEEYIVLANGEK